MRSHSLLLGMAAILVLSCVVVANAAQEEPSGGGGPMPSILFLDLKGLNAVVTGAGYPHVNEVLFTIGGSGYGDVGDDIRFGGIGGGGETTTSNGGRTSRLRFEYYGLMVEKAAASDSGLTVVLGATLGGGNLDLQLIDRFPSSFDDAVGTPYVASMTKDFYMVQPYIAFEAVPLSWMTTRFQLGLMWALTDGWMFEEVEFSGPPRTLTGVVASLTIRFGGPGAHREDEPLEEDADDQPLPESDGETSPEEPVGDSQDSIWRSGENRA